VHPWAFGRDKKDIFQPKNGIFVGLAEKNVCTMKKSTIFAGTIHERPDKIFFWNTEIGLEG